MVSDADNGQKPPVRGLEEVRAAAEAAARDGGETRALPPVHLWNPPFHGEIDMRIRRDGTWEYLGSPINRPAMVKLFASILRLYTDGHFYLVTPVEKVRIRVDDAPFIAVAMAREGEGEAQVLAFRTNVDDVAIAGPGHAIRFAVDRETGEPAPYVHVRAGLEALISRAVYYDLVAWGSEARIDGEAWFGVWSSGVFFPFLRAEDMNR